MINHPVICTSCGILSQNTYLVHQNISLLQGSDNSCTSAYPPKISTCNCQVWVVCTGAAVILGIRIPMDSLASPFIIVIDVPENPRKKKHQEKKGNHLLEKSTFIMCIIVYCIMRKYAR